MSTIIKYNSMQQIKEAVKNGVSVNYLNGLYYLKQDFEGDFVIKCNSSPMQELLSDRHNINEFFTKIV